MSVRRAIVEVNVDGLNVTEFCAQHGVSTWLFYELRRRYAEEGEDGLEPRSRAPKVVANRTPEWVEDVIVELRKNLEDQGLDAGPATIRFHLESRLGAEMRVVSEATIWRVLSRRGFITPDPKKAPKRSYRSFSAERANECWQIDDTEWELADGTLVKIINIIDDCTRVAVASTAVKSCTTKAAFDVFAEAARQWGWPARFLSDNAPAFRHGLADTLGELGIRAGHSRPYHPQTCGKVERFHQTVKRFLDAQPSAGTIFELQKQLDQFLVIYNHARPHRSLDRRIPANVWETKPKSGPDNHPLDTPTSIHRVKVINGTCAAGRRYRITIGAKHNHQTATVVITGQAGHVFIDGQLIRQLTIDPTRFLQPLYDQPGQPKTVRDDPRHP